MARHPLSILPSVTSSSYTIEARGLKFGMHNPHMDGSKVTNSIFDILLRKLNFKFYSKLVGLIVTQESLAFYVKICYDHSGLNGTVLISPTFSGPRLTYDPQRTITYEEKFIQKNLSYILHSKKAIFNWL